MSDLNAKSYPWQKPPEVGEFAWTQIRAKVIEELGLGPSGWASILTALNAVASCKSKLARGDVAVCQLSNFFLDWLEHVRRGRKHKWDADEPHLIDDPITVLSRRIPLIPSRIAAGSEKSESRTCRRDLKLSELRKALDGLFVVSIPESTLRRWAAARKIPGVYSLKRGHYRVRICPKLCRWAAELHFRDLRRLDKEWERSTEKKELIARVHHIALLRKDDVPKALIADPRLYEQPLATLDPQTMQKAADHEVELRIASLLGAMNARQLRKGMTSSRVAKMLGIPRRTFYRK